MKFLEILKNVLPQISIEFSIKFNISEQKLKEETNKTVGGVARVKKD